MMHTLVPVLLALLPQEPDLAKMVDYAKVSLPQAVATGLRVAKSGVVTKVELEFENDRILWSLDVAMGHKALEVHLDAKHGRAIASTEEATDASALVDASRFSLVDAVAAVLAEHPGVAVMAEMRVVEGRPAAKVVLFQKGRKATFVVDMAEDNAGQKPQKEKAAGVEPKKAGKAEADKPGETGKPGENGKPGMKQAGEEEEEEEAEEEEGEQAEQAKVTKPGKGKKGKNGAHDKNGKKQASEEEEEEEEEGEEAEQAKAKKPGKGKNGKNGKKGKHGKKQASEENEQEEEGEAEQPKANNPGKGETSEKKPTEQEAKAAKKATFLVK